MSEYVELTSGVIAPRAATNGHLAKLDEIGRAGLMVELLQERLAELEMAIEDQGWRDLSAGTAREFSREGLRRIAQQARLYWLKNPLLRHAVEVQTHYVMGQGVHVQASAPAVNAVIQSFWDDRQNRVALTSHDAMLGLERLLQLTGNLFFVFFVHQMTGRVRVRTVPFDEITEIISDPDDAFSPWYYRRSWQRASFRDGVTTMEQVSAFYPDWEYWPDGRPEMLGSTPVQWESPMYHIAAGNLADMRWGVPEVYPALDWARAVKEDLEDYATVKRNLARFAMHLTTPGGKSGVDAARTKLTTTLGTGGAGRETNPPATVGSTFISAKDVDLQPIRTVGAQPSPDEGRRLWLMVAAGTGIPETILAGDADVGNLATAKSLDRPTELKMQARQTMWEGVFMNIMDFVLNWAGFAPKGRLDTARAARTEDGWDIELAPDPEATPNPLAPEAFDPMAPMNRHIDVDFPSILDRSISERVTAIATAAKTGTLGNDLIARELMQALGVDDIDEELARLAQAGQPQTEPPTEEARFIEALGELREALHVIMGR